MVDRYPLNILLVDDDPNDRLLLRRALTKAVTTGRELNIEEASSVEEGVAKYLQFTRRLKNGSALFSRPYGVIDWNLGHQNGLELATLINAQERIENPCTTQFAATLLTGRDPEEFKAREGVETYQSFRQVLYKTGDWSGLQEIATKIIKDNDIWCEEEYDLACFNKDAISRMPHSELLAQV